MRETHTARMSIFDFYAKHEFGDFLAQLSCLWDYSVGINESGNFVLEGRMYPNHGKPSSAIKGIYTKNEDKTGTSSRVASHAGFFLHAGAMAEAHQHDKLERLCCYFCRPAVLEKRLSLTANGQIRYGLKTPYRNGATHAIFEPKPSTANFRSLQRA